MKELLIVANWKMNKTKQEAKLFLEEFLKYEKKLKHKVVLAPNFTLLDFLNENLKNTSIKLGAQTMFYEEKGAFTGEVSATMLKDFHVEYVILGHSERKQYFFEQDETINKKIITALKHNIKPILCVGESACQKEVGLSKPVVKGQVVKALQEVKLEDLENIIIAYEPLYAIGTGVSATSEEACAMAKYIVEVVQELFYTKQQVTVLYGGSVLPENANSYFECEFIKGALIGGASLDAGKFLKIIEG